ncbi:MAG: hypothetical protein ACYTGQ_04635 [Planctomycetota bacterium]
MFVIMTTTRPEIVIEGSYDGKHFKPYPFKYKIGPLNRRPIHIAPMHPRLDWQLWFEALNAEGGGGPSPWFQNLLVRILENSPPVLDLLEDNPFKEHPPTYIRAVLYDYRMTDLEMQAQTGNWWQRDLNRIYVEPIALMQRPE